MNCPHLDWKEVLFDASDWFVYAVSTLPYGTGLSA